MSAAARLLERLRRRGIVLEADGGMLRLRGDRLAVTDELLAEVREHKAELLSMLRDWTAADARNVIASFRDAAVRAELEGFHERAVAAFRAEQPSWPEAKVQEQAFGALLFEILRSGIDLRTAVVGDRPRSERETLDGAER